MNDGERDMLMGLADDAIGQSGGLSRHDQVRLGELALRAWAEVEQLRAQGDEELGRVKPDIIIDYMQTSLGGFITVDTADLPAGTNENDHIVVADHDAEPAAARVVKIGADRTSIRILTDEDDDRERVLLLIAEAKRLRTIVRGLAAISPLAALEHGALLCWACGVYTPSAGTYHRDGAELTADDVVMHSYRDDTVGHLPSCVWLLAATYEPEVEPGVDDQVAARAWELLGDLVRIIAAEDDAQAEYDESPELQELLARAAASKTAVKIDIPSRRAERRARAEREVQDRDEGGP